MSLGILITRFSSSEIRNRSLSVQVKFTHVVGGVVPDTPVACVLSKVSSTLGLGLVLAVANEVLLLLDSPMVMMSTYQRAVHSDVLYDIGTRAAV